MVRCAALTGRRRKETAAAACSETVPKDKGSRIMPNRNLTQKMTQHKRAFRIDRVKTILPLHILILPGVIATFIFSYIPMYGIIIAFKNFNPTKGILGSSWVGLKYFKRLIGLPDFYDLLRNTVSIAFLKITTLLFFSLVLALLLNELRTRWLKSSIQSLIIFPHFLSWVILGSLVKSILADDGMINRLFSSIGLPTVFFMGSPFLFRGVLIATNLWQEAGFSAILFTAAIAGIDSNLYEAARIDGANRWQQTIHITISSIRPFIILLAVLNIGNILNAGFDQIFNLYNILVINSADVIDTYVYRIGLMGAQYSFGTAVGLFKAIVGAILIGASYYLADKYAKYRIF